MLSSLVSCILMLFNEIYLSSFFVIPRYVKLFSVTFRKDCGSNGISNFTGLLLLLFLCSVKKYSGLLS